ncbi:MAG: protein kinase domain-containing protein, partial [Rubripirellula sp.]
GTRGYLPPERLKGYPGDYRSDFFSLGCVAYEMLSGKMLHQLKHFESENRLYLKVIDETDQWRTVPDQLQAIVLGMLHSSPEERICEYDHIVSVLDQFDSRSFTNNSSTDLGS